MIYLRRIYKTLIFWLVVWILLSSYVINFSTSVVHGASMYPTLKNNDLLLFRKNVAVKNGDIVMIWSDESDKWLAKRVIGIGGDIIEYDGINLCVNNSVIDEYYINGDWFYSRFKVNVPSDYVFVMGDNRNNSLDSRELGCLKAQDINGVLFWNITSSTGLTQRSLINLIVIVMIDMSIILIISIVMGYRRNLVQDESEKRN